MRNYFINFELIIEH